MVETRHGTVTEPQAPYDKEDVVAAAGQPGKGAAGPSTPTAVSARASRGPATVKASSAQLYTMLALVLAGAALPCFFLPKLTAKFMFGSAAEPPEDQHKHLLQINAGGLLAAAAAALALEEAARKHMLHSFTADTLKLALVGLGAGNLLNLIYYPATPTFLAALLHLANNAVMVALPASQLFLAREDLNRVSRDFRQLPRNIGGFFSMRQPSVKTMLYMILTVMFPLAGFSYFAMPRFTLYHTFGYVYGKSTQWLWKMAGLVDMTVVTAITATLKDKAENNLLGRSIARTLNLGLMLCSLAHMLVLGPILSMGHGGVILPLLATTWGTALLTSMLGLAAPELSQLAEQTAEAAKAE